MAHLNLQVSNRTVVGNQVRKLRRDGILPAVMYSNALAPVNIQLPLGLFTKIFKESGRNKVIDIIVDDKKSYPCIVHSIDLHPVSGVVRHVDFLFVNLKQKVVATVPLVFIGQSKAVKELGGVLNISVDTLEISALPDEIPSEISIDVSLIEGFSDVIRVSDILTTKKYEIQEEPEFLIASVTSPTSEMSEDSQVIAPVVESDVKSEENKK